MQTANKDVQKDLSRNILNILYADDHTIGQQQIEVQKVSESGF